jgi:hypothetical protein
MYCIASDHTYKRRDSDGVSNYMRLFKMLVYSKDRNETGTRIMGTDPNNAMVT